MTMSRPWLALPLLLSACNTANHDKVALPLPEKPAASPSEIEVPGDVLAGQWQVTAFSDGPIDKSHPLILLSGTATTLRASSQCIWWRWTYEIDAKAGLAIKKAQWLPRNQDGSNEWVPPPMCARSLSSTETRFAQAMEGAKAIALPGEGNILIYGGPDKIWLMHRLGLEGMWTVASLGGKPLPQDAYPIEVGIDAKEIRANSQCLAWKWRYTLAGNIVSKVQDRLAVCLRPRLPSEVSFETLMRQAKTVRPLGGGKISLGEGDAAVVLEPLH